MKKSILMGAAAALAMLVPLQARADTGGTIGGALAALDSDDDAFENFAAIGGVVLTDLGSNWSGQLKGASIDLTTFDHSHFYSLVEFGINRHFGDVTVGGFLGQLNDDGDGGWTYGLGARTNFGRFTLAGSVSGAGSRNDDDDEYSNLSIEGGMALTPRWRLGVVGSWSDIDEEDVNTYGADLSFQATPMIGIGAFYRNSEVDDCCGGGYDVEAVGLNLRLNFGDDVSDRYMPGSSNLLYDVMTTH